MDRLIGNTKKYFEELNKCNLKGIEKFNNSFPWPISSDTNGFHIACYFNEKSYCSPEDESPLGHTGIDLQVQEGTPLYAPETGTILFFDDGDPDKLVNIFLYGMNTPIVYGFGHLDPNSTPQKIKEKTLDNFFDNNLIIREGGFLGKVGNWPHELSEKVNIPSDVERMHSKNYHHLHFTTSYYPDGVRLKDCQKKFPRRFNPLQILLVL